MNQQSKELHNGWSNYETWIVSLWINNEQPSYLHWRQQAHEMLKAAASSETGFACASLADVLQEKISEQCAVPGANLASDLMGAALARVDWHEIAQEFLDDAREAE